MDALQVPSSSVEINLMQPSNMAFDRLKVAIVHDYLNQSGGAERVVEILHGIFPEAPIFTSIVDFAQLTEGLRTADIRPSFMQHLPKILRAFRWYLPIYPVAFELMDLKGYDIIISSSSAFAKGVRTPRGSVHICYCYTPMRYIWGFSDVDLGKRKVAVEFVLRTLFFPILRFWDKHTAKRPTRYLAISNEVARRIASIYRRPSDILYPPVRSPITPIMELQNKKDNYDDPQRSALVISRLVSYKRVDLAIIACESEGIPLRIIGSGPHEKELRAISNGSTKFLGRVPDDIMMNELLQSFCLILPGYEDFGMTPVEANMAGIAVLAYGKGGALETVIPEVNGILFFDQTIESVIEGLHRVFNTAWDAEIIKKTAKRFSVENYQSKLLDYILALKKPGAKDRLVSNE